MTGGFISNPNPDLEALERLCPEAASEYEMYGRYNFESALMVNPKNIKAIAACIVRLGEERESILVDLYRDGAAAQVARLCDEKLDQSGALLGRIRSRVHVITWRERG